MTEVFDPYHRWLGIGPEEQPPHHYRLLGIRLFEDDLEAIENAANRILQQLRTFASGEYSPQSLKLLSEVTAAKLCLLDPQEKAAYDAKLRKRLAPRPVVAVEEPEGADGISAELLGLTESLRPRGRPVSGHSSRSGRKAQQSRIRFAVTSGAVCAVILVVAAWALVPRSPSKRVRVAPPPKADSPSQQQGPSEHSSGSFAGSKTDTPPNPFQGGFVVPPPEPPAKPGETNQGEKPSSDGRGLWAEFFRGTTFKEKIKDRIDRTVDWVWGDYPPDDGVERNNFSVRWSGWLKTPRPGSHRLVTVSDDGVQVWLDNQLVIDHWGRHPPLVDEHEVQLTDKPHALRINYFQAEESAVMSFRWVVPGGSVATPVPAEALFNDRDVAERTAVVIPEPAAVGGHGLRCELFEGLQLERGRKVKERTDRQIDWLWGQNAPEGGVPAESFSIRWTGFLQPPRAGRYTLIAVREGGARMFLDGETVFDDWSSHPPRRSEHQRELQQKPYDLKIEYCAAQSSNLFTLRWITPGEKAEAVIPVSALIPKSPDLVDKKNEPVPPPAIPTPQKPVGPGAPGQAAQEAALAVLKQRFGTAFGRRDVPGRLALAAVLIRQAREADDKPAEQYVMLAQARELACSADGCLLALLAVDELAKRFEVGAGEAKIQILEQIVRRATSPATLLEFAESVDALARESFGTDTFENLVKVLRQGKKKRGAAGRPLAKRLEDLRPLSQAFREALAAQQANPNDAAANLELGRLNCVVKGEWPQGLALLAKGGEGRLSECARRLAQSKDAAAQRALADAWWEAAEKDRSALKLALSDAALRWYRKALPGLKDDDLAEARRRLQISATGSRASKPAGPLAIPLNGLGGLGSMAPDKTVGLFQLGGGLVTFSGHGSLEYPRVPSTAFVHELEITFAGRQGSVEVCYDDGRPSEDRKEIFHKQQGVAIRLAWDDQQQKVGCELWRYWPGFYRDFGKQSYSPGQRLRFVCFANAGRYTLFEGLNRIGEASACPADMRLCIQWTNIGMSAVTISSCRFRPLDEADAAQLQCVLAPTRVEGNWGESALRLHERNLKLGIQPVLTSGDPFVVASTGTAMQSVAPGSFDRKIAGLQGKAEMATKVSVTRGFWIGRYEISQGEWLRLPVANPSRVTGSPFLPVEGVGYEEVRDWCMLLNQQEDRERRLPKNYNYAYRLPTEAEWELACRAGKTDEYAVDAHSFWHAQTSGWRPHEVGESKLNALGLYDMHGNVQEWCLDVWQDWRGVPIPQLADPGVFSKDLHQAFVLRGGGWWAPYHGCAAGDRWPAGAVPGGHRGFRLVLGPAIVSK